MNAQTAPTTQGPPARHLRILAVTRKPDAASFEQRVLAYIRPLSRRGVDVTVRVLPRNQRGQWRLIGEAADYDGVWWQRHLLAPWLLPRLRWSARALVFDFDDPVLMSSRGGGRPSWSRRLRFAAMLRSADAAMAASQHLRSLAEPYCKRIFVQPMAVDLPALDPPRQRSNGPVRLVWVGTQATLPYLDLIRPALEEVGRRSSQVRLRIVASATQPPALRHMPVDFRPWSKDEEDTALRECHIGLTPLPDTPWGRGKCPYKTLLYMAYAMPWVGAAVGENAIVARDQAEGGDHGLCATAQDEWIDAILRLVHDPDLREAMGQRGRAYVQRTHDRNVLTDQLVRIWKTVAARPRGAGPRAGGGRPRADDDA